MSCGNYAGEYYKPTPRGGVDACWRFSGEGIGEGEAKKKLPCQRETDPFDNIALRQRVVGAIRRLAEGGHKGRPYKGGRALRAKLKCPLG